MLKFRKTERQALLKLLGILKVCFLTSVVLFKLRSKSRNLKRNEGARKDWWKPIYPGAKSSRQEFAEVVTKFRSAHNKFEISFNSEFCRNSEVLI